MHWRRYVCSPVNFCSIQGVDVAEVLCELCCCGPFSSVKPAVALSQLCCSAKGWT